MRKAAKIILLIWDILLIPAILVVVSLLFDLTLPFQPVLNSISKVFMIFIDFYLYFGILLIAPSKYLIPQIITLALIVLNFGMSYHFRKPAPTRKEIIQSVLLSWMGILGAVCAYFALVMMT